MGKCDKDLGGVVLRRERSCWQQIENANQKNTTFAVKLPLKGAENSSCH